MTENSLATLFDDTHWLSRSVFVKALTTNDDSGRHGVLVPREAYRLFPPLEGGDETNPSAPITTAWAEGSGWEQKDSFFRQYDRYPERRLTSLDPSVLNRDGDRLFAISVGSEKYSYRVVCVVEGEPGFEDLRSVLGTFEFIPGTNAVIDIGVTAPKNSKFDQLLKKLRAINEKGWIKTVKRGDTGVGMTLEAELGVDPNVDTGPDLLGIELKASRARKGGGKVTLFAKTPKWGPGGSQALLDEHGYQDDKRDRWALYHSIYGHIESKSGWRLKVDEDSEQVFVARYGESVVDWDIPTLEDSLLKKHSETVFVEAETRGKGDSEEFRYSRVTHAAAPTIDRFLALIPDGRICLDFTMQRTESGKTRDHGFLFRIVDGFQPSLFSYTRTYELGS